MDSQKIIYVLARSASFPVEIEKWIVVDAKKGKVYTIVTHLDGFKQRVKNADVRLTFNDAFRDAAPECGRWIARERQKLVEAEAAFERQHNGIVRVVRRNPLPEHTEEQLGKLL